VPTLSKPPRDHRGTHLGDANRRRRGKAIYLGFRGSGGGLEDLPRFDQLLQDDEPVSRILGATEGVQDVARRVRS
jgi:hypothetical protein